MDPRIRLVIGNKNYSSWSLRPWLLLKHFSVIFDEIRLDLSSERFHQQVGSYSPTQKVPVLLHHDEVIWESLAICEWVNEALLFGKGWPESISLRTLGRSISSEMSSGFHLIRTQLPMNCRVNMPLRCTLPHELQDEIDRVKSLWEDSLQSSGGPWLLGDFSIADCMFAPMALRFKTYGIVLGSPAAAYRDQVLGHPAIIAWLADAYQEVDVLESAENVCLCKS